MYDVVVIGGGPAGMMSAYSCAEKGNSVLLVEKNEKLGKKLYITGKGRCNVTNDCSVEEFLDNVISNPKFLMGSLRGFTPEDTINFLQGYNLPLKTERGNRVFPLSDKSSDVIKCLEKALNIIGVEIALNENVLDILEQDGKVTGIVTDKRNIFCKKVVVCTGGLSYKSTGSTGDGYTFAKKFGHDVVPLRPALVGLNLKGELFKSLQGLSLKNVGLTVYDGSKAVYSGFGEMLFTHFGVSGPIVLSASSKINRIDLKYVTISIDLKPALSLEKLDERVLRDFAKFKNKALKNSLDELLPKSLIPIIIELSKIDPNKKNNVLTAQERRQLVSTFKDMRFAVASLRDINEAIVTSGGVNVKQINPKNMESKLIKGLFFAGEVLDLDAFTGGFNIQIALSTGYSVGK